MYEYSSGGNYSFTLFQNLLKLMDQFTRVKKQIEVVLNSVIGPKKRDFVNPAS